ncbi:substrate-binding domain-containing protein [Comamonas sp. lk]|uniref:substrate-binding domain-containing protein n=1 Tax=Comamonas sp. lk TaxID=2201272 RepID=UPI000EB306EE|nr:substrate-binding domain-containing protein [Comamonas sp. lk]
MSMVLRGISSMATRQVLAELAAAWQARGAESVTIESVGGVDAAKRVAAGDEAFDVVFLANQAIDKLIASGRAVAGSKVDLVLSSTVVAVRADAAQPDISSEDALRAAVLAAPSIGYSTGPSGVALQQLFERWGIAQQIQPRIVQARPGVPVGSLVASGEVALGFQQLSELIHVAGIAIVGPLPAACAIDTVFSGAVVAGSHQVGAAERLLAFMASAETAEAKRRQGMEPA